jgi:subtilisin-like proprotein convertase family protein
MSTKRFYVPDNNPTGITDSIFVAAGGNLQDIKVALIMNHTYAGDMRITLINPLGTSVMLTPNSGTQSGNDIITVFDMTADSTISYSSASIAPPYTPRIKPANPFAPLYGQNAGGWWKLKFVDVAAGDVGYVSGWGIAPQYPTGTVINTQTPYTYELAQNYPNPFNPSTSIKYSVALDNITKLVVYDITGREVSTLINGFKKAGNYEITFDASKLASGVYFYKLESGSYTETKKMMLIK